MNTAGTVKRFSKSEIMLHWSNALPFLVLLASGVYLAWEGWEGEERMKWLGDLHRWFGVALMLLPPLVLAFAKTRLLLGDLNSLFSFGKLDLEWIKAQSKGLHTAQGKFNFGQKMNGIASVVNSLLLQITGVWLWLNPQGLLARWSHILIAVLVLPLLGGHLFMAMVNPSTRKGFLGIFTGQVPREYMEEHHALQLQEIENEAGHEV